LVEGENAEKAILHTAVDGLDIVPSSIDLVGAEIQLLNRTEREKTLKKTLSKLKANYDFILIDCTPSLGLLTVNALTAADSVIIPVQCEFFALEGISKLLNTIKIVQMKFNENLEIEGFVLTMYDNRLKLANQVVEEVRQHFDTMVFKTIINRNVTLSEAPSHGIPVLLYDAESKGAQSHLHLAKELLIKNSLPLERIMVK
jgi:chromosome partitioning protein